MVEIFEKLINYNLYSAKEYYLYRRNDFFHSMYVTMAASQWLRENDFVGNICPTNVLQIQMRK